MSDLEADVIWLAAHQDRWTLQHPIRGVQDWTMVVWPRVEVRRSHYAVSIQAETLGGVLTKAADWFRETDGLTREVLEAAVATYRAEHEREIEDALREAASDSWWDALKKGAQR